MGLGVPAPGIDKKVRVIDTEEMALTMPLLRALVLCAVGAGAHVQLLSPMTRNTVDRNLPQWRGGRFGNNTCIRTPWHVQGQCTPAGAVALEFGDSTKSYLPD